jgi:hypothetical protein
LLLLLYLKKSFHLRTRLHHRFFLCRMCSLFTFLMIMMAPSVYYTVAHWIIMSWSLWSHKQQVTSKHVAPPFVMMMTPSLYYNVDPWIVLVTVAFISDTTSYKQTCYSSGWWRWYWRRTKCLRSSNISINCTQTR